MSSLQERIEVLEKDLLANPPRISAYHDLPFAILHYDPVVEFAARKQISLLATRLQNAGKRVRHLRGSYPLGSNSRHRRYRSHSRRGTTVRVCPYPGAVSTLVSDSVFRPLPDQIEQCMRGMEPAIDIVFLVRIAALRASHLPLGKTARRHAWPHVGAYHLVLSGHTRRRKHLRFMDLSKREQTGAYNYRVKIY